MPAPFLETPLPLVCAPMAGGPSSLALIEAATGAGALAFLAAGYKSVDDLEAQIHAARATASPFGVNVFVPDASGPDPAVFAAYAERLARAAEHFGVELSHTPIHDEDGLADKLALLRDDPVPVVSFTFGLPDARDIQRLQRAGSSVLATVTTVDEALAAAASGVDGLVVQGSAAGGHSATWNPARTITDTPTAQLVTAVRGATSLPILAAGGVDGPGAVAQLLQAGASSVVVGTLLLRSEESGASDVHKQALASGQFSETALTRVFTGRPARALRNAFVAEHDAAAITAYPAVHHLTRGLRQAAAAAGDANWVHLWAGTGFQRAEAKPAGEILAALVAEL